MTNTSNDVILPLSDKHKWWCDIAPKWQTQDETVTHQVVAAVISDLPGDAILQLAVLWWRCLAGQLCHEVNARCAHSQLSPALLHCSVGLPTTNTLIVSKLSTMWSHVLYNAFKDDFQAIQWCYFCLSLSQSLLNILQLFASFSQNPKLLQWRTVLTTLGICHVTF